MSVKGKGSPAERRKGDLVVRCHPSAKSGHPWLAERCKEELVVKCHPSVNSGQRKFVLVFMADGYGAGTESVRRTYVDQFTGSGLDPLIISPARGHSEAVAYLMSKAGAGANVSALMYLRRPGTKQ